MDCGSRRRSYGTNGVELSSQGQSQANGFMFAPEEEKKGPSAFANLSDMIGNFDIRNSAMLSKPIDWDSESEDGEG